MSGFVPPFPKPRRKRPSLLRRAIEGRHCPIRVLSERSYRMKLGSFATPSRKVFVPVEPPLVRRVLHDRSGRYPKSRIMLRMLEQLIGNSIFVSNGEVWRRQRKLLEPAFNQARVQDVFPRMLDAVAALERRLEPLADGDPVELDQHMSHVTADIIFRTICSVTIDDEGARQTYEAFVAYQRMAFAEGIFSLSGLPRVLSVRWWMARRHARRIRQVLDPVVRARWEAAQRDGPAGAPPGGSDILSALLSAVDEETGKPLDFAFDELVEQIAMLFLAGHETSAAALTWAFYLIANDPEVQERLRREAEDVLGGRAPTFADLKRLALTRDTFREALRLYPPVAFLARDAAESETMRDKAVPQGSLILVSPWISQRHETHWERPHEFDPDRFGEAAADEAIRTCYFPFSQGPRVCVGAAFALQEATLVIAMLVRRFEFLPVPGHVPRPVARLTLRSENGVRLCLRRR